MSNVRHERRAKGREAAFWNVCSMGQVGGASTGAGLAANRPLSLNVASTARIAAQRTISARKMLFPPPRFSPSHVFATVTIPATDATRSSTIAAARLLKRRRKEATDYIDCRVYEDREADQERQCSLNCRHDKKPG